MVSGGTTNTRLNSPYFLSLTVYPSSANAGPDRPRTVSCLTRLYGQEPSDRLRSAFFTPGSSSITVIVLDSTSQWTSVRMRSRRTSTGAPKEKRGELRGEGVVLYAQKKEAKSVQRHSRLVYSEDCSTHLEFSPTFAEAGEGPPHAITVYVAAFGALDTSTADSRSRRTLTSPEMVRRWYGCAASRACVREARACLRACVCGTSLPLPVELESRRSNHTPVRDEGEVLLLLSCCVVEAGLGAWF